MSALKFGVVGTVRGMTFIQLLQGMGTVAHLSAVCETDVEKAQALRPQLPAAVGIYSDYDAFLDSGLDAVILCNFFHEHAQLAIRAAAKGIHVLSDTTAAPTMAECVQLCEAVEKSGIKYMLGANGPYKACVQYMKQQLKAGKLGRAFYAEAEYLHDTPNAAPYEDSSTHWRRLMPGTYYNMHTLGTLMFITETLPKKVTGRVIRAADKAKQHNRLIDHDGAKMLCEMDSGATFDVTGCCYFGPTSKWYRLIGENGVLETQRYNEKKVLFASADAHYTPTQSSAAPVECCPSYDELGMRIGSDLAGVSSTGHGGIDFWMLLHFIRYLQGTYEPFFNVYRSVALSAAAILAWRSILDGCREYEIPDFACKEVRQQYANDFLSPFAPEGSSDLISRIAP